MQTRLLIAIIISALVSSCFHSTPITKSGEEECIPPLYDVAFPIVPSEGPDSFIPRQIPPGGKWQVQDNLPFKSGVIYLRPKQNELLFAGQFDEIFIYSIDNASWRSYSTKNWDINTLFVAKDGTIWGTAWFAADSPEGAYPLLIRFNETIGDFEFVEDASGFLKARHTRLVSNIAEDQSGLLWFWVDADQEYSLTSFDVKTSQSKQHYSLDYVGATEIVVAADGSIWTLDKTDDQLVQYFPSSQKSHTYKFPNPADTGKLPNNFDRAGYIYMDHSERLWVANYGWLEFSDDNLPIWHRVIESPVLISDRGLPASQYTMSYQVSTYQSSNSLYWFNGGAGIVRLDLEKASWCLITTQSSNVVEDKDHNLWIAVFGHLYKYPLE